MSPDEVKREARESEGDPQLKAARKRAHHELLARASIPEALYEAVAEILRSLWENPPEP